MIQRIRLKGLVSDYGNPRHDREWINGLRVRLYVGEDLPPIIVSTEPNGGHQIVDGEHRHSAYREEGREDIPAYVLGATFDEAAPLRRMDAQAKHMDRGTNGRWKLHAMLRRALAERVEAGTL